MSDNDTPTPEPSLVGYAGRAALDLMRAGSASACYLHREPVSGKESVAIYEHPPRHHVAGIADSLVAALEPFADQAEFWSDQVSDKTPLLEKDNLTVGDVRRAAKALSSYRAALSATSTEGKSE